jgi:ligand-binding sensor domain-containing protein/signal transduction histidine kinase
MIPGLYRLNQMFNPVDLPENPKSLILSFPKFDEQAWQTPGNQQSRNLEQNLTSAAMKNLRFDRLSAADGLSFSLTTSLVQDQQSFMWFGTRYGLNKYDGFNFTIYVLDDREDVLFANYVTNIFLDQNGDLWISTLADLVRRDHTTGEFVHYKHDPADSTSLGAGQINTIAEDGTGNLWIGTNQGLNRYNPSTETFTRYMPDLAIVCLLTDSLGGIWLGTYNGLYYYVQGTPGLGERKFYQNNPDDPASVSSNIITAVYEDRQDILWVGTWDNGLNRLDRTTDKFTRFQNNPDDPYSLSNNQIRSIREDTAGRFWVGTDNGLNLSDPTTSRFIRSHFDPNDSHSLSSDVVNDIYEDRSGVIWFATLSGISKLNETASVFTHYQQGSQQFNQKINQGSSAVLEQQQLPYLSDNIILSILQDSQGIVWIGTSQGGLNRLDRSTGEVTIFRHDPGNPNSLSSGEIDTIYEDSVGTLWIGTSDGLTRFDRKTGVFVREPAFEGHLVGSVVEDPLGNLWVSFWGGILRRKPGANQFSPIPEVSDPLSGIRLQKLFLDRAGELWITTQEEGIFRISLDSATGESVNLVHFPQNSSDPESPGLSPIMDIYEDSAGVLWMGSVDDGLIRFNREDQTFTHFIPETGRARYVSCIQGDENGNLWMGTKTGLARFDPRSEGFRYFDTRDGLQVGEGLACYQNQQGEMFFGSWEGLNTFIPTQIHENPIPPQAMITAINLWNRVLKIDLQPNESINLPHQKNYLSFDFAALDYHAPAKNEYAYKMDGLDNDWVLAGNRRHADYPNLQPGSYIFRVKASNNSGVWNEQGATVRITITPPFWQTWWFLGITGIVLMGVIAGGIRLRFRNLEKRSRDLENQVAERTTALEQKNRELQELNEQSQELAVLEERNRLARELHDAVTQTLFSASLVAEALPATWEKDPHAGQSLLQELRNLCRGALAEMRTLLLELRPAALAESRLEDLLRQLGEAASGREGIPVTVQVEDQADGIHPVDEKIPIELPADVQIVFYRITQEALNNIVKHARAHQVTVKLCYSCDAQVSPFPGDESEQLGETRLSVLLSIHDDGRGFDPKQIPHDRLGLGIMQERAQAIGAQFTVESQPGKGTQVTVLWLQKKEKEDT